MLEKNGRLFWLLFVSVALLLRLPTFFPTVLDHDESTYILIASQLLEGQIPYVDNLDVKPVGIYLVFAGVLKMFNSIVAIRITAALMIAFSGLLIYYIHFILFSHRRTAMMAGILYITCASVHKWSWPANTEIFFQFFSLWGLYVLLIARRPVHFIYFGLIVSFGFLLKFHIAFDVMAFVIFYFFWQGSRIRPWLMDMSLSFAAFLAPLVLLFIVYWNLGYLNELQFAMYTIPSGYVSEFGLIKLGAFIMEYYLSFAPLIFLLAAGMWLAARQRWLMLPEWVLFITWTLTGWIGIALTGKFFFHYYFQALPVMCLFALTWFMLGGQSRWSRWKTFLERRVVWIFVVVMGATWINQYNQVLRKPDVSSMVYQTLKPEWQPGKKIYTSDKNILYYLLDTDPPTKYVHTTVIYEPDLVKAYQVNTNAELKKIVAKGMDYYVILKEAHPVLGRDIKDNFRLIKTFPGRVKLFRRINKK